jgi:hypothetical protein
MPPLPPAEGVAHTATPQRRDGSSGHPQLSGGPQTPPTEGVATPLLGPGGGGPPLLFSFFFKC